MHKILKETDSQCDHMFDITMIDLRWIPVQIDPQFPTPGVQCDQLPEQATPPLDPRMQMHKQFTRFDPSQYIS